MSDYDKMFTELMKIEEVLAKVKKKKAKNKKDKCRIMSKNGEVIKLDRR